MHPTASSPAHCLFLDDQQLYKTCQITVPDIEQPLAAIVVNGECYSFFRLTRDSDYALSVAGKLTHSGDRIAILKKKNGYSLWAVEPLARPTTAARLNTSPSQSVDSTGRPHQPIGSSTILYSSDSCQPVHIRVPDLEQPVKAIAYGGQYYSLFRTEQNSEQVISIVGKTARRGDETIVVKTMETYAICVIEPVAVPL
ncbi:MAG: hypothetical protein AAFR31_09270 [Cyanobacteria bacterium J06627_8]